jgi:5-methylcytosine-specific restriction endonuclease McrA
MKLERPWVCWLCNQPIPRDAHYLSAEAWTADHVLSLDEHPEIDPCDERNLRPAHKGCNSKKGARSYNPTPKPPTGSRVW